MKTIIAKSFFTVVFFLSFNFLTFSLPMEGYRFSKGEFRVKLENDTLIVENNAVRHKWLWNDGNLITCQITDKKNGLVWNASKKNPDLPLPEGTEKAKDASLTAEVVKASLQYSRHLRVNLEYSGGTLQIRKVIKLYPDCPAAACELYLKGSMVRNSGEQVLKQLSLGGRHWNIEAVEFFDRTDGNNNLVRPVKGITYGYHLYRGNILFAEDKERDAGIFFVKEAPTSDVQLHYPGGDFIALQGEFKVIGLGLDKDDIQEDRWTKAYGYVTGVYKSGKKEKYMALRDYQLKMKPIIRERDEMIMLNTWGDRGRDTRVNEAFCLKELELASKLGISHFQIDDGWQSGRGANSAYGGSYKNIWQNPDYWTPDPVRFPHGLAPIVKKGKELGIEIGLWFNPSIQNDYEDWEKDADAIIRLYKEYGIRTFKIDGTFFDNKVAENRLRMIYEKVMEASGWEVVLNLDATAGRRGGYFYFNEYGNIFLENRYTDWGNYYPYMTLRNLWMLSRYVNPQMLQIEFLNVWRNAKRYTGDCFAPSRYTFDYVFAVTMAAQPLAWLEAANLPEEAYTTGELIKSYRKIQYDLHTGYILPVGNEPSGESWCGFQSVKGNEGYFIVYREDNEEASFMMDTYFEPDENVEFTACLGDGKSFTAKTDAGGRIAFTLPEKNSFSLYRYRLRR